MQKAKLLLLLFLTISLAVPAMSHAWVKERGPAWQYEGVFADSAATGEKYVSGGHGIVVDKYDRVWIGSYYAGNTGGIIVLNPDGTPTDFSPIDSIAFADTTFNLAKTNGCRGMNVDKDGNILYANKSTLIKIDVETGQGLAYWVGPGSLTKPAVDSEGYIYVGKVVGVGPISVLDPATFDVTQEITLEPAAGYTRGIEVAPDGKTLIAGNLSAGGPVYIYTTDDYVTYTMTDSLYLDDYGQNIFKFQCVTMDWGPDGKLWISHDDSYGASGRYENGFVVVDINTKKYSYFFVPMDSTEYNGPRGIAFTNDGNTGYFVSFTASRVGKITRAELMEPGEWVYDDGLNVGWSVDSYIDSLETGDKVASGGHGIVVDKYDRIWIGSYYAGNTGGIVVLNPDGTPADFSPISTVAFTDTTFDLAKTNGCRGMNVDKDGNILYANKSTLIRLNVENGEGLNYWVGPGSLTKPAVDAEGYIYIGKVVGVGPISVLDPATFDVTQEITLDPAPGYTRGIEVTPDGKTIISANLSGGPAYVYTTEDYVTYTYTDSILVDTGGYPVFKYQVVTMDWGPDGNLWISHDDSYAATGRHDNGFVVVNMETKHYDYFNMPEDSTEYNGPRGIAFNSTGDVGYAVSFTASRVYKLIRTRAGIQVKDFVELPTAYILGQNYPNPFNPTTTIPFSLQKSGNVELKVYDILGREVMTLIDRRMQPGYHKVTFDGNGLASGVYHYRLKFDGQVYTKRMLLLK
ncbi:hypothetical protein B6D60_01605 [candidate division KSB1 bacterium 4484_87]|nr:MAG: hypothetical protein B6D60_01605 [candidate division KSB1 bacterium 4484_87]